MAHEVVLGAAKFLHSRLASGIGTRTNAGWFAFEQAGVAPRLDLIAEAVAVPDCAGTCFPSRLIGGAFGQMIDRADLVFPHPPAGLNCFPGFYSGDRREYILLTVRQLRAGLLRLAPSCNGGASVFPVGKSGG